METRVAVLSIIVENREAVGKLNELLHDYGRIHDISAKVVYAKQ